MVFPTVTAIENLYNVANFTQLYEAAAAAGTTIGGAIGGGALSSLMGGVACYVPIVALLAAGVAISKGINATLLKNDGKVAKAFMGMIDSQFTEFITYIRDYAGTNVILLKAKALDEELTKEGLESISYFASACWLSVKAIAIPNIIIKIDTIIDNWSVILPTAPRFWTFVKAWAYYTLNKDKLDFDVPGQVQYATTAQLINAIETAIPSMKIRWKDETVAAKMNSFFDELVKSNSQYYIVRLNQVATQAQYNGYRRGYPIDARSDFAYFIMFPTAWDGSAYVSDLTSNFQSSAITKVAKNVDNLKYEITKPGQKSTLQSNITLNAHRFVLYFSTAAALVAFNFSDTIEKGKRICNDFFNQMDNTNFSDYYNSYGSEDKRVAMPIYGGYINNEFSDISVEVVAKGIGSEIFTVTPEAANTAVKDSYNAGTIDIATGTSARDDAGDVIAGGVTIPVTDTVVGALDDITAGTKSITDVIAGIGSIVSDATVPIAGIIADTIADAIDKAKTDTKEGTIPNPTPPSIVPVISSSQAGLTTMYSPTKSEVNALGNYLWSEDVITQLKKIWSDPMESIINLSVYPIEPVSNKRAECILGYSKTGVEMDVVTSQYRQIKIGSITIYPKYRNFLDYAPYTKIVIYVPYVGFQDLSTDDVMGSTLSLYYTVDFLSGAFIATIYCNRTGVDEALYSWGGNLGMQIPLSSGSFGQLISQMATIGISAFTGGTAGALMATANNLFTPKADVKVKGGISGNVGALGPKTPYLIISRPINQTPDNYRITNGYNVKKGGKVGDYSGWTTFKNVKLNINASKEETAEIAQLLESGVYV